MSVSPPLKRLVKWLFLAALFLFFTFSFGSVQIGHYGSKRIDFVYQCQGVTNDVKVETETPNNSPIDEAGR